MLTFVITHVIATHMHMIWSDYVDRITSNIVRIEQLTNKLDKKATQLFQQ